MCVSHEEENSSAGTAIDTGGSIEQMLVTAPRIGIDLGVYQSIDWSKVAPLAILGGIGGVFNGLPGIALGSALGATTGVETQAGLTNLFQLEYDLTLVPGLPAPYIPLF